MYTPIFFSIFFHVSKAILMSVSGVAVKWRNGGYQKQNLGYSYAIGDPMTYRKQCGWPDSLSVPSVENHPLRNDAHYLARLQIAQNNDLHPDHSPRSIVWTHSAQNCSALGTQIDFEFHQFLRTWDRPS